MENNPIKNVLSPTEEGDAATKGYVDSKNAGESDLDMQGRLVKNVRWPEQVYDLIMRGPLQTRLREGLFMLEVFK